jgi:hypothetical protein
MDGEAAFRRFGRVADLLGAALADVPLEETLRDWRTGPARSSTATSRRATCWPTRTPAR